MSANGDVGEEMDDIRQQLASMQSRIAALTNSLSATTRLVTTLSSTLSAVSNTERIISRTLLFLSRNAAQSLRVGHHELSLFVSPSRLCAANSVTQVLMKTKSSDCTLAEFRILATGFGLSESFHSTTFPSEFYALSIAPSKCSRLDVLFPSYFDLCEALGISVDVREDGVYKEKRNTARQLRAVQVMGVDAKETGSDSARGSYIVLARSDPSSYCTGETHVLHQTSMTWSDNSCDKEFLYCKESLSLSCRKLRRHLRLMRDRCEKRRVLIVLLRSVMCTASRGRGIRIPPLTTAFLPKRFLALSVRFFLLLSFEPRSSLCQPK